MRVEAYQYLRISGRVHSEYAWEEQLSRWMDRLNQEDPLGRVPGSSPISSPFVELLPGEGVVGTYQHLSAQGSRGDGLTPHHIPAASVMKRYGVARDAGVCLTMEQPAWAGGRHRLTDSYGGGSPSALSARQALARDIRNARAIYESQELLGQEIRAALREVIRQNKEHYPLVFAKEIHP